MICVRSITKTMEEKNVDSDVQLGFSRVLEKKNHGLNEKIKNINKRLKRYCLSKDFLFIDKSSNDDSSNSLNKT